MTDRIEIITVRDTENGGVYKLSLATTDPITELEVLDYISEKLEIGKAGRAVSKNPDGTPDYFLACVKPRDVLMLERLPSPNKSSPTVWSYSVKAQLVASVHNYDGTTISLSLTTGQTVKLEYARRESAMRAVREILDWMCHPDKRAPYIALY